MHRLLQEIPWAARRILRRPGFFVLVTALLAAGTGAALVVASLYDQIVLRRLPVARPDELVLIERMTVADNGDAEPYGRFTRDECKELRRGAADSVDAACWSGGDTVIGFAAGAERVAAEWVSPNYFSMLGLHAAAGRLFAGADDPARGGDSTAVLSYAAWQRRFGMDRGVLGRSVAIDGRPAVVIGVAPAEFHSLVGGNAPEVFLPAATVPPDDDGFQAAGRLRPGVSRVRAETRLRAVDAALIAAQPGRQMFTIVDGKTAHATERIDVVAGERGDSTLRDSYAHMLVLVSLMVLGVMLILSFNLANLLAAHAADERRQNALRRALGASRGRLAAAWLIESLALTSAGVLLGLALASAFAPALVRALPELGARGAIQFQLDSRIVAAAFVLALVTALLIGALAAWEASRAHLGEVLRGAGRTATGERAGTFWQWTLVGVQVALSVVLLAGMGLLARSLDSLLHLRTGLPIDRVLTFRVDLPRTAQGQPQAVLERLRQRLETLPGVRRASYSAIPLLSGAGLYNMLLIEGYQAVPGEVVMPNTMPVGRDFFQALDLPAVRGRTYLTADLAATPRPVVVNRRFAQRYFRGSDPLGRRISLNTDRGAWSRPQPGDMAIVGVVADGVLSDMREQAMPRIYPLVGPAEGSVTYYLRTATPPAALAASVRRAVPAAAPQAALGDILTLESQRDRLLGHERLLGSFSTTLGLLAALLAGVGLYAVVSLAVARRTRDLVVRLALGARRRHIARFACRDAARAVSAGLAAGLAAAVPATALLKTFLYGVEPGDPASLAGSAAVLVLVAAAACWAPLLRALNADPAAVLRQE
jgi:putative ABC transport system permease protein